MKLHASGEDYLEAILILQKKTPPLFPAARSSGRMRPWGKAMKIEIQRDEISQIGLEVRRIWQSY